MEKMSKMEEVSTFVGDRRADSAAFTDDREVASAFDAEQGRQGLEQRTRLMSETESSRSISILGGGDVDVDERAAGSVGEEAPGGDNSSPGQDEVDEIGRSLGLEYDQGEPLHSTDKIEQRDEHRWELDPASAEDYRERHPM